MTQSSGNRKYRRLSGLSPPKHRSQTAVDGPLSTQSRSFILLLLTCTSTCLAIATFYSCSGDGSARVSVSTRTIYLGALLGTLSTLIPMIRNATMYLPWMVISMNVVSIVENQKLDKVLFVQLFAMSLSLGALAATKTLSNTICIMRQLLSPRWIHLVSIVSQSVWCISAWYQLVQRDQISSKSNATTVAKMFSPVTFIPGLVAIALHWWMWMWWSNRFHKFGNLLVQPRKQAAFVSSAIWLFLVLCLHIKRNTTLFFPVWLGAMMSIACVAVLSAVPDVWYPVVGTGPFWKVNSDLTIMVVFIVFPLFAVVFNSLESSSVPLSETVSQEVFASTIERQRQIYELVGSTTLAEIVWAFLSNIQIATLPMIGLGITLGFPMIQSMCPFGGMLFSDTYTHGPQSTGKLAICLRWSDVQYYPDIVKFLSGCPKSQKINIVVTEEDVLEDKAALSKVIQAGHVLLVSGSTADELARSLHALSTELQYEAKWCHVGTDKWSSSLLQQATDLDLKVCLWSHYIDLAADEGNGAVVSLSETKPFPGASDLTAKQFNSLIDDLEYKYGGIIAFLTYSSLPSVDDEVHDDVNDLFLKFVEVKSVLILDAITSLLKEFDGTEFVFTGLPEVVQPR